MTKKHFRQLAALVASYRDRIPEPLREQLARDLADYCRQFNARFDRHRFLDACELARG